MDTKSQNILHPFLYPCRRKTLIDNDISKTISSGTALPFSLIHYLNGNTMKPIITAFPNESYPLQMKLMNLNTSNICNFTATKAPKDISFERPEPSDMNHERPKLGIFYQSPYPTKIFTERFKTSAISPENSNPMDDSFNRPIPKDIAWTRVDPGQDKHERVPLRAKVGMGVLAGMVATTFVHPLDVIKVRLQLFPKKIKTMTMLRRIVACEGARGLYAGLTAGLLRQLTYTGTRLYVYNRMADDYKGDHEDVPPFWTKLRIAVAAGLIGAFVGTPSEVALVRMIEVCRLRRSACCPPCSFACKHVQHPESVIPQLIRIANREGLKTWWRGGVPTLIRSIFVTTAQVGAYYKIKQVLGQERDGKKVSGLPLHVCTVAGSSFLSTVLSLPIDQVKTRYQSFKERRVKSQMDILRDVLRKKGVKYLWKGFMPYYVRQAVHTVVTYVLLDQLVDAYSQSQETK